MVLCARPLPAVFAGKIMVARPAVKRHNRADLIHHVGCRAILPLGTHGLRHLGQLLPRRRRAGQRLDHLLGQLNAALRVREGHSLLAKRRGRQHYMGIPGALGQEEMLRHDQLALLERVGRIAKESGADRVVATEPDCSHLARDLDPREVNARPARALPAASLPRRLQIAPAPIVGHLVVTGQAVGQHAHVAHPLQVVVLGQREDAGTFLAELAGKQRQIHDRLRPAPRRGTQSRSSKGWPPSGPGA